MMVLGAVPAHAHTTDELDEWMTAWIERVLDEGVTLEAAARYVDMADRHPAYFGRPVLYGGTTSKTWVAAPPTWTGTAGVEQWRTLVTLYFPPDQVERALRVMACESGGNPNAKNSSSSASGLFQHLAAKYWVSRAISAGWAGASVFDPEANIAVAAWLQRTGGWSHWVCRG